MAINVVDLFSGVGGLSYGFSHYKDGFFNIVLANEIEPDIAKAYSLNNPSVLMVQNDIKKINKEFLDGVLHNVKVDLVIGGPPCQSYSTLGKRLMDDRANLFVEYCRILKILEPSVFIFENVKGLLSMEHGILFPTVIQAFRSIGYDVKAKLLNAVDFGVPQFRQRVILVGTKFKNDFDYPIPQFFESSLYGNKFRTVKDAIGNLPVLESGQTGTKYLSKPNSEFLKFVQDTDVLTEDDAPKNGPRLLALMRALPDGGSKFDLPSELMPKSGYGNTYAKMWWNKPAPTITRNFATPSSSRCIHPRDSRALTTREGARLQSFPDSYKFYGSRSMKNLEIGNAVPPLLSIALAKQIRELFKRHSK